MIKQKSKTVKGTELKIIFKNSKAYLTDDKPIVIPQLDSNDYVTNFKSVAYWTIRVISYIEGEKRIFCEVLSYQNGESQFDYPQKQLYDKLKDIKIVSFKSISTPGLLSTIGKTSRSSIPVKKYKTTEKPKSFSEIKPIVRKPFEQSINETFYVPIKDVNFKLGHVSFKKKFREYQKAIELEIPNDDIREEYDAIKNYFANVLKTKKIQVTVNISIVDDKITNQIVNSPEIDTINKQLVDEVKLDIVKSIIKGKTDPEKGNRLSTLEENFETKSFYDNDDEFLDDLLKVSNTKHYKHLRFLSSKHAHESMKLRYIYKPFAFIFLIKGVENFHFVWETLNTEEATYVWHVPKELYDLETSIRKIEESIKSIKTNGKLVYIRNTEDKLSRIYHDYYDPLKGFNKWKEELERKLI